MPVASLNILIAEDTDATRVLLTKFLEGLGHHVIIAENGLEAVTLYKEQQPDLILTDITMPVMDGLEALKIIRQEPVDTWVPIIVLSALGAEEDIIKGLESGADDYLTKPINLSILRAKINAMQRIVSLQNANKEATDALRKANYGLEQEQILAKKLADNMLSLGDMDNSAINYWLCPTAHFSGDLIAASYTIGKKFHVMLADSTGHGLAAALPTLTIAKVFHSMSNKGFMLSAIANEMNNTLKNLLTADRFVATALFTIDFQHQTIECWNGGLPTALLVNESGDIIHQFKSSHLAIGILPPEIFDASTTLYHWQGNNELIVYSDGVIEAEAPSGKIFDSESLKKVLALAKHGERLEAVKEQVLEHLQSGQGQDDISLLSVRCDALLVNS